MSLARQFRKVCAPQTPRKVLMLIVGNPTMDGYVSLADQYARQIKEIWPSTEIVAYMNCLNYPEFTNGKTYYVSGTAGMPLLGQIREVAVQAFLEGELDGADLVWTNMVPMMHYVALLGIEVLGASRERGSVFRMAPTVCDPAKVNYPPEELSNENQKYGMSLIWGTVGRAYPHMIILQGDSLRENELVEQAMLDNAPEARVPKHQLVFFHYEGPIDLAGIRKQRKVIWSGRANAVKDPVLGGNILSFLSRMGVEVEAWIPSGVLNVTMTAAFKGVPTKNMHFGSPKDVYLKGVQTARVAIITSKIEAMGIAYVEMVQRGVIPIFIRRPWSEQWLGPEWPFLFRKQDEAVAMALEALDHYKKYADLLDELMRKRYSLTTNLPQVLMDIWQEYRLTMEHRMISIENNASRVLEGVPDERID